MAKFSFKAKKGPQEFIEDVLEAESLDRAVEKITALGYVPIDVSLYRPTKIKSFSKKKKVLFFYKKVSLSELVMLTRQLYDLLDSGVPLLKALRLTLEQGTNPHLKKVLAQIYSSVQDGGLFSDALAQHRDVFSPLYVNMVKAGEISGKLDVVLERLATFLEKDSEARAKIQNSLIYPSLILGVGMLTIFVLLTFVIPRLTEMFEDLSANLPLPTVILIAVSDFLSRFWWLLAILILAAVFYFKNFASSEKGTLQVDRLKLKIPVLGNFIQCIEIARFSRTLSTLLESGVVIVSGLESVSDLLDNAVLKKEAREIARQVAAGASLSEALKASTFFPADAQNMISIGEEAGRLEASLLKLAVSYEKKSDALTKTLTSMLEPLLIVFIGLVVGFVVISMLLPIFQMNFIVQ
ncbi:MAG: type II secretion system F family protein [Candidatus Aceula meridiana]|nr:type II secretion system F family protein [Candidatus Aceula meridiana]